MSVPVRFFSAFFFEFGAAIVCNFFVRVPRLIVKGVDRVGFFIVAIFLEREELVNLQLNVMTRTRSVVRIFSSFRIFRNEISMSLCIEYCRRL